MRLHNHIPKVKDYLLQLFSDSYINFYQQVKCNPTLLETIKEIVIKKRQKLFQNEFQHNMEAKKLIKNGQKYYRAFKQDQSLECSMQKQKCFKLLESYAKIDYNVMPRTCDISVLNRGMALIKEKVAQMTAFQQPDYLDLPFIKKIGLFDQLTLQLNQYYQSSKYQLQKDIQDLCDIICKGEDLSNMKTNFCLMIAKQKLLIKHFYKNKEHTYKLHDFQHIHANIQIWEAGLKYLHFSKMDGIKIKLKKQKQEKQEFNNDAKNNTLQNNKIEKCVMLMYRTGIEAMEKAIQFAQEKNDQVMLGGLQKRLQIASELHCTLKMDSRYLVTITQTWQRLMHSILQLDTNDDQGLIALFDSQSFPPKTLSFARGYIAQGIHRLRTSIQKKKLKLEQSQLINNLQHQVLENNYQYAQRLLTENWQRFEDVASRYKAYKIEQCCTPIQAWETQLKEQAGDVDKRQVIKGINRLYYTSQLMFLSREFQARLISRANAGYDALQNIIREKIKCKENQINPSSNPHQSEWMQVLTELLSMSREEQEQQMRRPVKFKACMPMFNQKVMMVKRGLRTLENYVAKESNNDLLSVEYIEILRRTKGAMRDRYADWREVALALKCQRHLSEKMIWQDKLAEIQNNSLNIQNCSQNATIKQFNTIMSGIKSTERLAGQVRNILPEKYSQELLQVAHRSRAIRNQKFLDIKGNHIKL